MEPTQSKPKPPHYTNQTPEYIYPHSTHDLNTASQHFLSAAAFSPAHSISPTTTMGIFNWPVDEYYDKAQTAPVSLFNTCTIVLAPSDTDFNRIGIVLESDHGYLLFWQPINTTETNGPICGWLTKGRVGDYLVMEWDSLPKTQIGKTFMAAMNETATEREAGAIEKEWHVHSAWMTHLRAYAADWTVIVGQQLEFETQRVIHAGAELPDKQKAYMMVANKIQRGVLDEVRRLLKEERATKAREEEEAERAMEECLEIGDE